MKLELITKLVLVSIFTFSSCYAVQDETRIFNIFIGTNSEGFEDDSFAIAGGKKIDGDIFIYLNENPIAYYGGYGSTLQINQWLKDNENTFSIKGHSSKDLYIKIASVDSNGENFKLITKKHINAGDINASESFKVNLEYKLPLFDTPITFNQKTIKEEIIDEIISLKNDIANKSNDSLINKLLTGPSLWLPIAYNVIWSEKKEFYENSLISQFFGVNTQVADFNIEDIKIIYGKTVAYVYSGINNETIPEAYLFKIKEKETVNYIPAAKFIKHKNKWIIWQ